MATAKVACSLTTVSDDRASEALRFGMILDGRITHYFAGVGTGGSTCGVSRYLKEKDSNVVTVGIDTYGSKKRLGMLD